MIIMMVYKIKIEILCTLFNKNLYEKNIIEVEIKKLFFVLLTIVI